jgi:hypothetical protein
VPLRTGYNAREDHRHQRRVDGREDSDGRSRQERRKQRELRKDDNESHGATSRRSKQAERRQKKAYVGGTSTARGPSTAFPSQHHTSASVPRTDAELEDEMLKLAIAMSLQEQSHTSGSGGNKNHAQDATPYAYTGPNFGQKSPVIEEDRKRTGQGSRDMMRLREDANLRWQIAAQEGGIKDPLDLFHDELVDQDSGNVDHNSDSRIRNEAIWDRFNDELIHEVELEYAEAASSQHSHVPNQSDEFQVSNASISHILSYISCLLSSSGTSEYLEPKRSCINCD